jgi:WhiB family redox-sensing transcriptional regulator
VRDLAWMEWGLCRETDPAMFYPEQHESGLAHLAKKVCDTCEVRSDCLRYALNNMTDMHDAGMFGIWGGTSRDERLRMTGRRAA